MNSVVPSYKYDIFISYAHVDDVPFAGIENGWVSNLFRVLSAALSAKIGPVSVASAWQAVQSEDNVFMQSEVFDNIEQSAILLVILSPGYLASKRCQQELDHFIASRQALPGDHEPRIVVVEKNRNLRMRMPDELSHLTSHRFWAPNEQGRERTLALPQPSPSDALYYQKIDDLATNLASVLEQMRLVSDPAATPIPRPEPLATVFLAEVTEDLYDERDSVKRYLEQFNVRVLPDQDIPAFYLERDHVVIDQLLAESDLFVQLLSGHSQWHEPEPDLNWARLQYDRAREYDLPVLQWCSPALDLDAVSEAQRELLRLDTVQAMPIEEFKRAIRQRLSTAPRPQPLQASQYVFLNTSDVDQRLATQIGRILTQLGLEWELRLNQGRPSTLRNNLESHLQRCDALMVVYGEIGPVWVKRQLEYYRHIPRAQPFKALGLYEGPPEDKEAIEIGTQDMQVLSCRDGIDEVQLRDFLAPLLTRGES